MKLLFLYRLTPETNVISFVKAIYQSTDRTYAVLGNRFPDSIKLSPSSLMWENSSSLSALKVLDIMIYCDKQTQNKLSATESVRRSEYINYFKQLHVITSNKILYVLFLPLLCIIRRQRFSYIHVCVCVCVHVNVVADKTFLGP